MTSDKPNVPEIPDGSQRTKEAQPGVWTADEIAQVDEEADRLYREFVEQGSNEAQSGPLCPGCGWPRTPQQSHAESCPVARGDGARCHRCGHYETSYERAASLYAHCPSCSRHTRWERVPNDPRTDSASPEPLAEQWADALMKAAENADWRAVDDVRWAMRDHVAELEARPEPASPRKLKVGDTVTTTSDVLVEWRHRTGVILEMTGIEAQVAIEGVETAPWFFLDQLVWIPSATDPRRERVSTYDAMKVAIDAVTDVVAKAFEDGEGSQTRVYAQAWNGAIESCVKRVEETSKNDDERATLIEKMRWMRLESSSKGEP